jgi:hypothetical protein
MSRTCLRRFARARISALRSTWRSSSPTASGTSRCIEHCGLPSFSYLRNVIKASPAQVSIEIRSYLRVRAMHPFKAWSYLLLESSLIGMRAVLAQRAPCQTRRSSRMCPTSRNCLWQKAIDDHDLFDSRMRSKRFAAVKCRELLLKERIQ